MATRGIDRSGAAILLRCSNDEPRTVTGRLGRGLSAKRGRDGCTGMIQPANSNTRRGTRDSTSDNATPDLSACWVIDRDRQGRANHTEARRGGRGQLCSALPWTRRQGGPGEASRRLVAIRAVPAAHPDRGMLERGVASRTWGATPLPPRIWGSWCRHLQAVPPAMLGQRHLHREVPLLQRRSFRVLHHPARPLMIVVVTSGLGEGRLDALGCCDGASRSFWVCNTGDGAAESTRWERTV